MSTANREEPSISLKPRQLEPGRSSSFASPLVPPTTRGRHARLGQTHGALSQDYHQAKHTSSAFTTDGLAAGDLSMKPVPTRGCSKRCHGIICSRMFSAEPFSTWIGVPCPSNGLMNSGDCCAPSGIFSHANTLYIPDPLQPKEVGVLHSHHYREDRQTVCGDGRGSA